MSKKQTIWRFDSVRGRNAEMSSKFDRVVNKQRSGAAGEHEDCDGCVGLRAMRGIQQHQGPAAAAVSSAPGAMPAPPDIGEVGRGTWTLLHTMAAYYPEKADAAQQRATKTFLESLGAVVSQLSHSGLHSVDLCMLFFFFFSLQFPCRWCADDFVVSMNERPPQLATRSAFAQWLCQAHNEVNVKLGKPMFDCALVDKRWRATPPSKPS